MASSVARRRGLPSAAALAIVASGAVAPDAARGFLDGPPARVTGGFGEDSCHACHFGQTQNDPRGSLALQGFPERYVPGRSYELRMTLSHSGMLAAGFQLTVRVADDGRQAGKLEAHSSGSQVQVVTSRDVRFAQHAPDEVFAEPASEIHWTVLWTAPHTDERLQANASAVAGDGDGSQAGDFVYTLEAESATD